MQTVIASFRATVLGITFQTSIWAYTMDEMPELQIKQTTNVFYEYPLGYTGAHTILRQMNIHELICT